MKWILNERGCIAGGGRRHEPFPPILVDFRLRNGIVGKIDSLKGPESAQRRDYLYLVAVKVKPFQRRQSTQGSDVRQKIVAQIKLLELLEPSQRLQVGHLVIAQQEAFQFSQLRQGGQVGNIKTIEVQPFDFFEIRIRQRPVRFPDGSPDGLLYDFFIFLPIGLSMGSKGKGEGGETECNALHLGVVFVILDPVSRKNEILWETSVDLIGDFI